MSKKLPRQTFYLSILTVLLFFGVLFFAFKLLIPEGKEYRKKRASIQQESRDLRRYQEFYNQVESKFRDLQKKNRAILEAFDTPFDADKFQKLHKDYFSSLYITKLAQDKGDEPFLLYEVNATTQISSPKSFYNFLDAVNKSGWIIGVNFPINFERDGEVIKSSFTMKIYGSEEENNETKKAE